MRRWICRSATGSLLLLVANAACHPHGAERPIPASQRLHDFHPAYPTMLRSAGVEGEVAFEVRTDSAGHPLISTFTVGHSSNDLFRATVKKALGKAQGQAFQVVRDTVFFRVFRATEDSVKTCAPAGDATVVCARQPEPTRRVVY